MPVVTPEKLAALQQHGDNVRNICVLAHVDHGKTSLTDALIATNGIISPKMAGKIRYLDSRPDEQLRGITMESSAISLLFSMLRRPPGPDGTTPDPDAAPVAHDYLVNLIDSPGHIDFSSEVSTASRLCDGAVVLVDAVEGVCSQTVTVLRQTWIEKLKPLLVINKMDRLVTELRMTPAEAFVHVSKLLEQVNAVLGSFFQGERMEEDLNWRERMDERVASRAARDEEAAATASDVDNAADAFQERDDEDIYFAPEKNNVIFSSAIDGWAFTVRQFAVLYERKLGIKSRRLEKVLWGNFYLDPKTKKVLGPKHLKGRALKPMFVQLVLEPIWAVYAATVGLGDPATEGRGGGGGGGGGGDPDALARITRSLGITIPPHIQRARDPRLLLTTIFSAWLPLSTALLVSVVESLPSPRAAQHDRMGDLLDRSPDPDHIDPALRDAMVSFRQEPDQPVVVYVSKMVSIPESELPENRRKTVGGSGALSPEEARDMARRKRAEIAQALAAAGGGSSTADTDEHALATAFGATTLQDSPAEDEGDKTKNNATEHLIGFARIYSGTLAVGDEVFVLPPKFAPAHPHRPPAPRKCRVEALYMIMGRNLESLDRVPAGVVFGIRGLEGAGVLKAATLCSQVVGACNLAGVASTSGRPIVRVALEPANPADLERMIRGLQLLVQSDPCAEYEQHASGEHVLLTAGELHLERCLTDLRERFARCEIQVGPPIVPYRETIVRGAPDQMRPPANKELGRGAVHATTSSKHVNLALRVRPLPAAVTAFLSKHASSIRKAAEKKRVQVAGEKKGDDDEDNNDKDTEDDKSSDDDDDDDDNAASGDVGRVLPPDELERQLRALFEEAANSGGSGEAAAWKGVVDRLVAFGPRRVGPNVLVDATATQCLPRVFGREAAAAATAATSLSAASARAASTTTGAADERVGPAHFADKIVSAFQLAMAQGPLCHEPVQGVAVLVEDVQVADEEADGSPLLVREHLGRLTGEVIKTAQQAMHRGFLDWSPRLMLAMYSCEIQASTEVLGRVYDVLTRRRGRVLSETMKEGTPFFTIMSLLPVAESFGFSDDMRKRTSGAAQPQLLFAGFEVLDEDPFWVPFTEDDLEDLGQYGDRENVAKRYMDGVRRRKGLLVEGRNVARDAEKQKTLKR